MKTIIKLFFVTAIAVSFTSCNTENINSEDSLNISERKKGGSDEKGCETAFAYCKDLASCFIDNGFKRWGWALGPISDPAKHICEIYAGAGQCNIVKGTNVGYIDFDYVDGSVRVHFTAYEGYEFYEIHLYVGNEMFPTKPNGKPTVAPGQFPYKGEYPEGIDYVQFNLEDQFEGDIYIIAHAVVCESSDDKVVN